MRKCLSQTTLGALCALYRQDETGRVELLLLPAGTEGQVCRTDCAAEPLVQAKLTEDDAPAFFSGGRTMRNSPTTRAITFAGQNIQKETDKTVISTTLTDPRGLWYTHILTLFAHNPAAEVQVTVENRSDRALTWKCFPVLPWAVFPPFRRDWPPAP